ncbi:exocyst complex component Sec10-domain-containing protein [Lipomyces arxii]|uniref:exocyst complex component Sec10-domain-containing protein n=1 Tax=Lipomyces arxii TaxID=56418 RepID=UPI0034CD4194
MSSIYDLDPDARDLLSQDTFLKQISATEFVEKLTAHNTIQERHGKSVAINPKPYIRTFEAALDALRKISADLNNREQRIQFDSQQADTLHQKTSSAIEAQCQTLTLQFADLDLLVSEVASTTTSLGETVDLVSRQRNRAASSSFIIKCYIAFLNNDTSTVDAMRTGSNEDQRQCAITIRQLLRLARKITSIPRAEEASDNIEKYAEMLERELLVSFDKAYRAADLVGMKDVAVTLTEFNGGASVIQIFVNQHEFFIVKDKLLHEFEPDDSDLFQKLSDPNCTDIPFDKATLKLFDEIRATVKQECGIIKQVFPHPDDVLRVFLQRLFAQTIQQRVELKLSQAKSISTLAYLRVLERAHSDIGKLVADLKAIITADIDTGRGIAMLLDQNMQDLFVPFVENRQYIETEKKNLQELAGVVLARFNAYHMQKKTSTKNNTIFNKLGSVKTQNRWVKNR